MVEGTQGRLRKQGPSGLQPPYSTRVFLSLVSWVNRWLGRPWAVTRLDAALLNGYRLQGQTH